MNGTPGYPIVTSTNWRSGREGRRVRKMNSKPVERGWRVALRSSWGLAFCKYSADRRMNKSDPVTQGRRGLGNTLIWSGLDRIEPCRDVEKQGDELEERTRTIPSLSAYRLLLALSSSLVIVPSGKMNNQSGDRPVDFFD